MIIVKIKRQKPQKGVIKKLKLVEYKHCLEESQLKNKTNHVEKHEVSMENLKIDYQDFIKDYKLILKMQQRFKIERHNAFTENVNKIALISNDDKKRNQLIW